jgi:hypothetical protein
LDKSLIPSPKMYSVFHNVLKDDLIVWITEFSQVLGLDKEWSEMRKSDIVDELEIIYKDPAYHQVFHERILNDFPESCGIGPSKTEEILGCTKTERKRWESEGKLPVVKEFNSGSGRNPIWVPMYCRRTIENLTEDMISLWRAEHEEYKSMKRRTKEKIEKKKTLFVEIRAVCEGYKIEKVFGPVAVLEEDIDQLWNKHKDNLPFEFQESNCSVFMLDFQSQTILKHQLIESRKLA